ncbi:hypothetical protein BDW02DRAFT_651819 [Decorospora gaudefroyi]|uniref:Uncharacterized protein n=1 Tax=Decorospora gaudefroyi TaxID=184978 RepID=A0A6A5JW83_9PLEO|nr:hypothetical protein BDW02DRAFT_651819 [Decorospora gaudefroyi]
MPITRAAATLAMSEESEETSRPRISRFREHTNTNNSIRPPPDDLWKDLGIETLIEQFNQDNAKPAVLRKSSANQVPRVAKPALLRAASGSATPNVLATSSAGGHGAVTSFQATASAPTEGTYARFQRAFASMFGGVLGKRKAGAIDAEREKDKQQQQQLLDDRKKAAEAAYHEAKDLGLLPTPKVFVRPAMAAKGHKCGTLVLPLDTENGLTAAVADSATPMRTPRTPSLHHSTSKKDLHKQKKLSKRVSNLELKLASARKELHSVLHSDHPPVPPLPTLLPPTPDISQSEHEAASPNATPAPETPRSIGKIVKKRKATTHESDTEYMPLPTTDSDGDIDIDTIDDFFSGHSASERENEAPERMIKRVKSSASRKKNNPKRPSTRLQKRVSRSSMRTETPPVRVVPDGVGVPDVPAIPREMQGKGKRVRVGDDGFGGLGHEIF